MEEDCGDGEEGVFVEKAEWDTPPPEPEDGVRRARVKRGPKEPTPEEVKEHDACHVPFRPWCRYCVAAAATASPHMRDMSREAGAVPEHHVDYWCMRDHEGAESVPVVVIKDSDTKAFGAHACLVKGNVDWVAERLCEDGGNFGCIWGKLFSSVTKT